MSEEKEVKKKVKPVAVIVVAILGFFVFAMIFAGVMNCNTSKKRPQYDDTGKSWEEMLQERIDNGDKAGEKEVWERFNNYMDLFGDDE